MANDDPKLTNVHGLSIALRLPYQWLKDEAKAGRIPCLKIGRRMLFNPSAVELALSEQAGSAKVATGEQTRGQQVATSFGIGIEDLTNPLPQSYDTYRTMRKDPTIALARALTIAPIVAGDWMVEADDEVDDERIKFIRDQFLPMRESVLQQALLGGIDFGWQPFEKVFEQEDGHLVLRKLKPLLHDITIILVDKETGAFAGFRQEQNTLPLANCLLISFRVEGTQWHGASLLENIRATFNKYTEADAGAMRYDKKLAGASLLIECPSQEEYEDDTKRPNTEIGLELGQALQSSGIVVVPQVIPKWASEMVNPPSAWKFDVLQDSSSRQPGFTARLDYLDKLKARGLEWPERAILEGMFGTKAEAGAHQGLAITNADLTHRHITRFVNWHCVDHVLALNYGEEARGTVRLVAAPLVDAKLEFLRGLYTEILKHPQGFMEEYGTIDSDGLKDTLGVPKTEEVDRGEDDGQEPAQPGVDVNDPLAGSVRSIYRAASDVS